MFYTAPKKEMILGFVKVHYRLFLKNWKLSDGGNFEKPLSDVIVKLGYIEDDRKIIEYRIEKIPSLTDAIEIIIEPYGGALHYETPKKNTGRDKKILLYSRANAKAKGGAY
jgi:hypothetical protein